ncbi:hypothetical protein K661_02470 [Piscirickettsia salmonis LF-89 = ATCC VR-1361]|nr:hypothetical protein K661_02470 [Piscirickettsia salmonis LF-89 = ATCC VR-1361]
MLFLAGIRKKYRQVGINWDDQCFYSAGLTVSDIISVG